LFWFAAEIFYKVESYLTFLNIHQLERQGADIQSKVEELEELNQSLKQRDKIKDNAVSQLSAYGFDNKNAGSREKTTGMISNFDFECH
jgi:TolA-binding protein